MCFIVFIFVLTLFHFAQYIKLTQVEPKRFYIFLFLPYAQFTLLNVNMSSDAVSGWLPDLSDLEDTADGADYGQYTLEVALRGSDGSSHLMTADGMLSLYGPLDVSEITPNVVTKATTTQVIQNM